MAKTFKQVNDWDFIYMLNPFTLQIDSLKVKLIKGLSDPTYRNAIPSTQQNKEWVSIEYYRPEGLLQVTDLEKAHTATIIVDGTETIMLVALKIEGHHELLPIPYSSDKKALEAWILKTK